MQLRFTSFALICASTALLACAKSESKSDSAMGTVDLKPLLTDANIAALLDGANAADSADGSVAATKATNAEVKEYGTRMMMDHHNLRKHGADLVTRLNISPELPVGNTLPADAKVWNDSLKAMPKGAAWDRAYIDQEVAAHEMVLATIEIALSSTQTPELKALLNIAKPAMQGHLALAKSIQGKLAGTP
jgi:putative membrane protein